MSDKQTTELVLITPDWAAAKLKELDEVVAAGKFRQRPPRHRAIQRYAQDMKAGKWKTTHQGIALSPEGLLLDGQNRLWAVVESGVSVKMMVTYNQDPDTMDALDDGIVRSLGQKLMLADGSTYSFANECSSTVRQLANLVMIGSGMPIQRKLSGMVSVSPAEALYILNDLNVRASIERFGVLVEDRKMRRAPFEAPWCLFHSFKPKLADDMAKEYGSLTDLPKGSPVLAMYKYFTLKGRRRNMVDVLGISTNAIRKWYDDEPMDYAVPSREAIHWLVTQNQPLTDKILQRVIK